MTKVVAYPAVFDDTENKKGEYTVTFPDVQGAIADGNNIAEAINSAAISLGLILFDATELPEASDIKKVQEENLGKIVSYVSVDLDKAAEDSYEPMTRKNTRIPTDIAKRAEKAGINFSVTLTEALEKKLAAKD
ncbi:type II toxin-antitoxin system HicB family antitoxin [Loigolactobacillus iwatensis]|uniref:type II toxin-antitoxin system HicB family antitoxin n=1 Tax=Loigolactobacillus iwatensis TaxID=1267156 RepID=UPI000F7E517A|nr:type II toxin-antitoxin system HicB family antitoxin [Loigolactobacillus iwatensis]